MNKFLNIFKFGDKIGEPPYDYLLLISLSPDQYPAYLKKIYKRNMGKDLNLRNPKTFSEKIQWLKLYDTTPKKTILTDKVSVRSWVREQIGEEYLKPVLWVGKDFNSIPFDTLPNSFFIKTNHGCKWQYKVKDKEKFLNNKDLYNALKGRFDAWLSATFFPFAGFELQYKDIEPKILIEPVLIDKGRDYPIDYEIFCFNSQPKLYQKIVFSNPPVCSVYEEDYSLSEVVFNPNAITNNSPAGENLKLAVELSKKLAQGFKFVRIDWLEFEGKIYFNEMTFTPFSGFLNFIDKKWDKRLGNMINLKK